MTFDPAILFGTPTPRVDGVAKVTGAARYASDEPVANPAFACLVTSDIARGHITGFNLNAARAVSGVLDILTYETVGDRIKPPPGPDGAPPRPRSKAIASGMTARSLPSWWPTRSRQRPRQRPRCE
jgi:CO/xanthine dehydrogenase Mo-binding subunit